MRFWDTSAIIPLCLSEPRTDRLKRLTEADTAIVVWWTALVECYATFARLRREATLSSTEEADARRFASLLFKEWTEIEPANEVRDQAGRVLLLHPLKAADSLHLAAAILWANGRPTGHEFVCLDQRLRDAAHREGFKVMPDL